MDAVNTKAEVIQRLQQNAAFLLDHGVERIAVSMVEEMDEPIAAEAILTLFVVLKPGHQHREHLQWLAKELQGIMGRLVDLVPAVFAPGSLADQVHERAEYVPLIRGSEG
jgi:predicted nucleotidyltransferase